MNVMSASRHVCHGMSHMYAPIEKPFYWVNLHFKWVMSYMNEMSASRHGMSNMYAKYVHIWHALTGHMYAPSAKPLYCKGNIYATYIYVAYIYATYIYVAYIYVCSLREALVLREFALFTEPCHTWMPWVHPVTYMYIIACYIRMNPSRSPSIELCRTSQEVMLYIHASVSYPSEWVMSHFWVRHVVFP